MLHDAGIFTVPASTGRGQYRRFFPTRCLFRKSGASTLIGLKSDRQAEETGEG